MRRRLSGVALVMSQSRALALNVLARETPYNVANTYEVVVVDTDLVLVDLPSNESPGRHAHLFISRCAHLLMFAGIVVLNLARK
jgi:hypothetical protein